MTADQITKENDEFELKETCVNNSEIKKPWTANLVYAFIGMLFGIVFVKAEIVSWFRIQEMFRFESFHMYGIIGTAILVGAISIFIIKKYNLKTVDGEKVVIIPKTFNKGQIYGGFILGWAITGACPGPLFAQIGSGFTVISITFLSAITGTWVYGYFQDKLPH
jgi:hypothetical protein